MQQSEMMILFIVILKTRNRDMDETGNRHSQQTDTRTENQQPHVLSHKWVLNNENTRTQGGEQNTPGPGGRGTRGGIAGDGGIGER